jgi:hypothetical protein
LQVPNINHVVFRAGNDPLQKEKYVYVKRKKNESKKKTQKLLKHYFSSSNREIGKDAIFFVFVAGVGFQAFALKKRKKKGM